jgi:hypothetical protein
MGAPPQPQQGFAPMSSGVPDNQLALISLIAGIASYVLPIPILAGAAAVICGHMARSQIRASGGTQGGDGMAIAGLVLGYLHFAIICITLGIVAMMFFGVFAAVGIGAASH